jgi:hypothetical protein
MVKNISVLKRICATSFELLKSKVSTIETLDFYSLNQQKRG